MKRTPLERKTPLRPGGTLNRRKPMKQSQPKRNWAAARGKVERESMCRACGDCIPADILHAAHVVGREHDKPGRCGRCGGSGEAPVCDHDGEVVDLKPCRSCAGTGRADWLWVDPNRIVPLCAGCHRAYDPHTRGLNEKPVDLLPHLTDDEKRQAFEDCGFDAFAYLQRLTGQRYEVVE